MLFRSANIVNPHDTSDIVGTVTTATVEDIENALANAKPWIANANARAEILHNAADVFEDNFGVFFALLAREAGKILPDAVSELREAVDLLRHYAEQADRKSTRLNSSHVVISYAVFCLANNN